MELPWKYLISMVWPQGQGMSWSQEPGYLLSVSLAPPSEAFETFSSPSSAFMDSLPRSVSPRPSLSTFKKVAEFNLFFSSKKYSFLFKQVKEVKMG